MYSIAQIQLNHTINAINNLESALTSIEHYKKQVETALAILKDFKVGDDATGELSSEDREFLYHANSIGNDFSEEEENSGTTSLFILYPLEQLNNEYKGGVPTE